MGIGFEVAHDFLRVKVAERGFLHKFKMQFLGIHKIDVGLRLITFFVIESIYNCPNPRREDLNPSPL